MNPWQRQYEATGRRRERSPAAPTPRYGSRRRPEWNGYLTDSDRYKLSQQEQLQKQLQQLSTAHFASRSPSNRSFAARRPAFGAAPSVGGSSRNTPSKPAHFTPLSTPSGQSVGTASIRGSATKTARRLQFADELLSPAERRRKRYGLQISPRQNVSFHSDVDELTPRRRLGEQERETMQNELAILERMLWDLETETERLGLHQRRQPDEDAEDEEQNQTAEGFLGNEYRDEDEGGDEEELEEEEEYEDTGNQQTEGGGGQEDADMSKFGAICLKSLSIGMGLARKMDQLSKQVEDDQRARRDNELKISMLEQEVRSTQAKYNYLESKYANVATQLDDMREAVITTDEAIHRMAQAFEKTRFGSGRTSASSTPHKRSNNTAETPITAKQSGKATPKRSPARQRKAQREQHTNEEADENHTPNSQH